MTGKRWKCLEGSCSWNSNLCFSKTTSCESSSMCHLTSSKVTKALEILFLAFTCLHLKFYMPKMPEKSKLYQKSLDTNWFYKKTTGAFSHQGLIWQFPTCKIHLTISSIPISSEKCSYRFDPLQFQPEISRKLLAAFLPSKSQSMNGRKQFAIQSPCIGILLGRNWQKPQNLMAFSKTLIHFPLKIPAEFPLTRSH